MPTSQVTVCFDCPLEGVWNVVTNFAHAAWHSDLAGVEILDEVHFAERTKSGYVTNFFVTVCQL